MDQSTSDTATLESVSGGGGKTHRRRARSGNNGGGGRSSRTPRKDQQQGGSRPAAGQDEAAVWETPELVDERKEALNWQQLAVAASPQQQAKGGSTGRRNKQQQQSRPTLPPAAASAPPVPGQHAPFLEQPVKASSSTQEAPTWQQALFSPPAAQPSTSTASLPAGVLPNIALQPQQQGKTTHRGGRKHRRNSLSTALANASLGVNDPSSASTPPSGLVAQPAPARSATHIRQNPAQQRAALDAPPHLVPPVAPPVVRSTSLPAEEAAAMYAGPDYHASPAPEDIPKPRFPPRVR